MMYWFHILVKCTYSNILVNNTTEFGKNRKKNNVDETKIKTALMLLNTS